MWLSIDLIPDYVLFVFFGALGVLQLAFARSRTQGMLFVRRSPRASALLGAALVVAAFTWFFVTGPRNIPDTAGGLDGNVQALFFFTGGAGALVTTALLSSLINYRWGHDTPSPTSGLSALEGTTYMRAVAYRMAVIRGRVRAWIAR